MQKVTVIDLIPPSVECPVNVTVPADPGLCNADVTVPAPVVTDPCPYTMTNDYTGTDDASGNYPVGTTTVTWTITGISDNDTTCIQTITVNDTELPTITCPPDVVAIAEPPECEVPAYEVGMPEADDNCPGWELTWVMEGATEGSGSGFIPPTTYNVGVTTITYTVTDASGNADSCIFTVTVNDQVPPTIIDCPNDTAVNADAGECDTYIELQGPIVSDSCGEIVYIDNDSPYGTDSLDASGTYPVGVHTITWTFIDESGNDTSCVQTITVIDNQLPTITCPPDTSFIAEPPECEIPDIVLGLPEYWDNCPDSVLTWEMTGATVGMGPGNVEMLRPSM